MHSPLRASSFIRHLALLLLAASSLHAADPAFVDLRTVMRLAGANNDEIQLARAKHDEAIAESKQAWQRFWPALSLGAGYRGHDGRLQDIAGNVFNANKQQYNVGTGVVIDWSPGDIYYSALAAKQRALAAEHLAEKARIDIVTQSVERYYDLLAAEAMLTIIDDDLQLTQDYGKQLDGAVTAGTAFRADLLRVKSQISRAKLAIRQGEEQRDLAVARLAEILRLTPDAALRPAKSDLVPVKMMSGKGVATMISLAQQNRPEMHAAQAIHSSMDAEKDRTRVAPMIPSVQAGYSMGGLGGGPGVGGQQSGNFGRQQDFYLGFGWKIGPGGLFDRQRQKVADAREEGASLQTSQVKAAVGREVVEAATRSQSANDQIKINDEAVDAAEEMTKLAKERQASQVGVVLEYLLAREELTRARQSRVMAVTDFNKAQHALKRAVGK
ncbi:TolC family protein [Prosthecobacter sp.]|uniref:TolC family protein n=1 Tax=Prosthecobacter sp. TaxID=1965333 RepID=UPI002489BDC7|nr:TolC family protein [Prosthecobacter sp.]MDI1314257.1 TolC family protein [Prosthecobacter sp.]